MVAGGRRGGVALLDMRQRAIHSSIQAHDSSVKALTTDLDEACLITGSAEGNIKVDAIFAMTMWQLPG